jgi:hypothetical protein
VRCREPTGSRAEDLTVYLLPNPAPIRDAFAVLCTKRAKRDQAGYGALDAGAPSFHGICAVLRRLAWCQERERRAKERSHRAR